MSGGYAEFNHLIAIWISQYGMKTNTSIGTSSSEFKSIGIITQKKRSKLPVKKQEQKNKK